MQCFLYFIVYIPILGGFFLYCQITVLPISPEAHAAKVVKGQNKKVMAILSFRWFGMIWQSLDFHKMAITFIWPPYEKLKTLYFMKL